MTEDKYPNYPISWCPNQHLPIQCQLLTTSPQQTQMADIV